ncbi:MAG TPA: glycosyltransferase family 2 protein [Alphaproteobacteria bacterium]|jgi:glycosyltransferase involved in cell wall biosynthesis|nr:glycosyltransferase family 2 protein [Alphaproteobacteria bacterium]
MAQNSPHRPTVSIVIDSYNHSRYIGEAIDSALAQTYPGVEVVVADDGSTDSSPEVIRRYGDRIKTVFKANGGQASCLNAGYAHSTGEIVVFLDCDDALYPDAVEAIVAAWRPGVAKVQYRLDLVDGNGAFIGARLPDFAFAHGDIRSLVLRYGFFPFAPTSGSTYSRATLEQLMPIPEQQWRQGTDYYLSMLAALTGDIVSIDDKSMGRYRIHDRNEGLLNRITAAKLKEHLGWDYNIVEELNRFGKRRGIALPSDLPMRSPAHLKQRLMLLRDSPEIYPWQGDSRLGLAFLGIRRVWEWPFYGLKKRFVSSAEFLAISLLPAGAIMRVGTAVNRLKKFGWREPLRSIGLLKGR